MSRNVESLSQLSSHTNILTVNIRPCISIYKGNQTSINPLSYFEITVWIVITLEILEIRNKFLKHLYEICG